MSKQSVHHSTSCLKTHFSSSKSKIERFPKEHFTKFFMEANGPKHLIIEK